MGEIGMRLAQAGRRGHDVGELGQGALIACVR